MHTCHCDVPIGFALIDDVHHLLWTGDKALSTTLKQRDIVLFPEDHDHVVLSKN